MNQLATIRTDETFRETAAEHMKTYADETLPQLLDRYVDLTKQIIAAADPDGKPNSATVLLAKERDLVNKVASTVHAFSFSFTGSEPSYW